MLSSFDKRSYKNHDLLVDKLIEVKRRTKDQAYFW